MLRILATTALVVVGARAQGPKCGTVASSSSLASDHPRTLQPHVVPPHNRDCGWSISTPNPLDPTSIAKQYADTAAMPLALPADCREPPPAGAPDLNGIWQAYSPAPGLPSQLAAGVGFGLVYPGFFQSIQQCGYRFVIAGRGARHDGWCTGTFHGAMSDFSNPFIGCERAIAKFSYKPVEPIATPPALFIVTPLYSNATGQIESAQMHEVRIQNADHSEAGYAHRFRIKCPSPFPAGNMTTFTLDPTRFEGTPDLTKCMRTVIGLSGPLGQPPLVVDSVLVANPSDFANCRPQELYEIMAKI